MGQSESKPNDLDRTIRQSFDQRPNQPVYQPSSYPNNHPQAHQTIYQSFDQSLTNPNSNTRRVLRSMFSLNDRSINQSLVTGLVCSSLSFVTCRRLFSKINQPIKMSSGTFFLRWPVSIIGVYVSACVSTHIFINTTAEMYQRLISSSDNPYINPSINQNTWFYQSVKQKFNQTEEEAHIEEIHRYFPFKQVDWWHISGLPFSSSPIQSTNQSINQSNLIGVACGVLAVATSLTQYGPRGLLTILPSDLFKKGSFARYWIRASSADYADAVQKHRLHAIGAQFGCHSCGKRIDVTRQTTRALLKANREGGMLTDLTLVQRNQPIKQSTSRSTSQPVKKPAKTFEVRSKPSLYHLHRRDTTARKSSPKSHQILSSIKRPVLRVAKSINSSVTQSIDKTLKARNKLRVEEAILGYVGDHIPPSRMNPKNAAQIFLPQCPTCSSKQSGAVLKKKTTLVTQHWKRFTLQDLFIPWVLIVTPLQEQLELMYFKFGLQLGTAWEYVLHLIGNIGA